MTKKKFSYSFSLRKIKELLKHARTFQWRVVLLFTIIILAISALSWHGYKQLTSLSLEIASLEEKLASTTVLLQQDIMNARLTFSTALSKEKQNVSSIKEEVGAISGTLTTLEKLAKTDPELLQKYSKIFFLNEHYEPERLIELPDKYEYDESKRLQVHAGVWPYLENLLKKASRDKVTIFAFSSFRSFGTQKVLKGQYTITFGEGTANQFSADQGYSEHQLGTTVDFITTGIGGTLEGFEKTEAYEWLLDNAYRYGFVLSYPENNSFYTFEPWHWRFVGTIFATDLHSTGRYFYDLDQREIDVYLVSLFD